MNNNSIGKRIYIIGGSSGIGFAVAKHFCKTGAHIVLIARQENMLKTCVAELALLKSSIDQDIQYLCLDITDNKAVEDKLSALALNFGAPDLLINSAGRAVPRKFLDISYTDFDATLKVNLYGTRNVIAALVPSMKIKGGVIVNVASIAAIIGVFGYTDYCASKFAIIGFSEALRSELKQFNIRVAVLCPPDTDTPGYKNENLTKPLETRAISESAALLSSDAVAAYFITRLTKRDFLIIPGFDGRMSVRLKRFFPSLIDFFMTREIRKIQRK